MRRLTYLLIWILPLALAITTGCLFSRTERSLFPEYRHCAYGYGDTVEGGKSNTHIAMRAGILIAKIDLEPDFKTPYTGFGFGLGDSTHPQGIDFTPYDHFEIEMRSPHMHNVGFTMLTWIPGFTDPHKPLTSMFQEGATTVTPVFTRITVPFSVFSPSIWWPEAAGVSANTTPIRMDLVKNFEIRAPVGNPPPRHDTLEVRSIKVVGKNWIPLILLSLVAAGLSTAITLRQRHRSGLQTAISSSVAPVTRQPGSAPGFEATKVELPNRRDLELHALLQWVHRNYHKETIGVEDASRETGVSIRKIPQLLKDHAGKSYPAFIAGLRIAEACRLLRETDRQVSEISLAVGFSNASHFHRVFKAETGESPTAWRDKAVQPLVLG